MSKLKIVLNILLIVTIGIALFLPSAADDNRRDGNWWREQDTHTRLNYIVGFFDGMDLGNNLSYWDFVKDSKTDNCMKKVAHSYSSLHAKYFSKITNVQVADGLDSFYEDFRNRSICISDAVWLVVNSISGDKENKLDNIIENYRRKAQQE